MQNHDWKEKRYNEIFELTCRAIQLRRETEEGFTIEDAEGLLEAHYVNQGNDWIGRGEATNIVTDATVAAYEHMLTEWRKELGGE